MMPANGFKSLITTIVRGTSFDVPSHSGGSRRRSERRHQPTQLVLGVEAEGELAIVQKRVARQAAANLGQLFGGALGQRDSLLSQAVVRLLHLAEEIKIL